MNYPDVQVWLGCSDGNLRLFNMTGGLMCLTAMYSGPVEHLAVSSHGLWAGAKGSLSVIQLNAEVSAPFLPPSPVGCSSQAK